MRGAEHPRWIGFCFSRYSHEEKEMKEILPNPRVLITWKEHPTPLRVWGSENHFPYTPLGLGI